MIALRLRRLRKFELKAPPTNAIHTARIEPSRSSPIHKICDQLLNALEPFEASEAVASMRNDDMQAVGQMFSGDISVKGRRHRIPLAREN